LDFPAPHLIFGPLHDKLHRFFRFRWTVFSLTADPVPASGKSQGLSNPASPGGPSFGAAAAQSRFLLPVRFVCEFSLSSRPGNLVDAL